MAANPSVTKKMRKLSITSPGKESGNKDSPTKARRMRKRLSVVGAHGHSPLFLDGTQKSEL